MILKKLCDKCVTLMKKNSEIYGGCQHKATFRQFYLSIDDPSIGGEGYTGTRILKPFEF